MKTIVFALIGCIVLIFLPTMYMARDGFGFVDLLIMAVWSFLVVKIAIRGVRSNLFVVYGL